MMPPNDIYDIITTEPCVSAVSCLAIAELAIFFPILSINMLLLNLTVVGAHRSHIPWTVVQVGTGLTFSTLFSKIVAGSQPRLTVDKALSQSSLTCS